MTPPSDVDAVAAADADAAVAPAATALVLCGGGARRFGADKLVQPLGGTTVLGHLLAGLPTDWPVVGVGAERAVERAVTWVREDPPDGGPLAGIAAGMAHVTTDLVVVVGGDMPFAGPTAALLASSLASALTSSLGDRGTASQGLAAATARLGDGRAHPLLTAYATEAVRAALPPDPAGARARLLLDRIPHLLVEVDADDLLDVDTPAALEVARARVAP